MFASRAISVWIVMKLHMLLPFAALAICSSLAAAVPLKILQLAGGCCHDYENQKVVLAEGLKLRFNCTVDTVHEGDGREHEMSIFNKENWAADYGVILFNICYGHMKNEATHPVIWTNEYRKARVFGTTLGHFTENDGRGSVFGSGRQWRLVDSRETLEL
jgi:hypothetical protein